MCNEISNEWTVKQQFVFLLVQIVIPTYRGSDRIDHDIHTHFLFADTTYKRWLITFMNVVFIVQFSSGK
jgi:fumarate reductase subunit D